MAAPAGPASDPTTDKPPRPRRWIPLSLKMFVLILGTMTVWTGIRAYRQYVAIREIERLDGYVATTRPRGPQWLRDWVGYKRYRFCEDVDFPRIDEPTAAVTEATLAYISWLPNLRVLGLWNTPTTDAGLAHLRGMAKLEELYLANTQVTDAGLSDLRGMTNLLNLQLSDTQLTDAGLVHLKSLTSLRALWLDSTQVTDAGMVHLSRLSNLRGLFLGKTQVTDAGLAHLKGLTNLQHLELKLTIVTDDGVDELKQALPDLKVVH